ncbi:hypothetical protein CKF54_06295 [Psittacicella hinzii]|uniref:ApeI dehydratase-like domain-containing protein n=1 Tax=Psittacicella hinzii TaxID=2028575 RepID=A0A3A1Y262_9GAMM|nr:hypothetical protein [Psittacicella hinzii]RIY31645.1 hypothetical protein CKF54_06295 [Psittacicella hinzii]
MQPTFTVIEELASKLKTLPWVEQAVVLRQQDQQLVAWLGLNEAGIEIYKSQGRQALIAEVVSSSQVEIDLYYLTQAQANDLTPAQVLEFSTQKQTEVIWLSHTQENDSFTFTGQVPLDLIYFRDHFASFPLVPGVVLLGWIEKLVQQLYPEIPSSRNITNLKFQKFTRPLDQVTLTIKHESNRGRVAFKMTSASEPSVKGFLVYVDPNS